MMTLTGKVILVTGAAMLGGLLYRALRGGVITHTTMAEGTGPFFSEIRTRRLRLVKNLVMTET
jgi:hypothetical protein